MQRRPSVVNFAGPSCLVHQYPTSPVSYVPSIPLSQLELVLAADTPLVILASEKGRNQGIVMVVSIILFSVFAVLMAASRHPRLKGCISTGQAAGYALAIMLLFTATAHFNSMREDLIKMVPPLFPVPGLIVTVTGVIEYLGALGLFIPGLRRYAGFGLAVMFVAMFPANVYAALNDLSLRGEPVTPLVYRIPMQVLFIGFAIWATREKKQPQRGRTGNRKR